MELRHYPTTTTENHVTYPQTEFPSFPERAYPTIQYFDPQPNSLYDDMTSCMAGVSGETPVNFPNHWFVQAFPASSAVTDGNGNIFISAFSNA